MAKFGFTGTREGMTDFQREAFQRFIREVLVVPASFEEFHHGCCVGADVDAVLLLDAMGVRTPDLKIIGHPPTDGKLVSKAACSRSDVLCDPEPYLDRNKSIVNACDMLIACPKGPEEQRSGTWSTIRYAKKNNVGMVIIYPDIGD
jgi:hypothetical protein